MQYWEDWSGSTLGQAPVGWTPRWITTGATYTVEEDAAGPAGRALKVDIPSDGRRGLSLDALDSDPGRATIKIRALVRATAISGVGARMRVGAFARGSGSAGSESMYLACLYQDNVATNGVHARKYVSGSQSAIIGAGGTIVAGTAYWVGLELVGTSVRRTVAAASDPNTLLADDTSADTSLGDGWAGIFTFSNSDSPYYILAVGIGTNGDEAPTGAVAPPTPTKGLSIVLGDGVTPAANLTGVSVRWWDDPAQTEAPDFATDTATTNAEGRLVVNLDSVTALSIGDLGRLDVWKYGATPSDDIVAAGRVPVANITP